MDRVPLLGLLFRAEGPGGPGVAERGLAPLVREEEGKPGLQRGSKRPCPGVVPVLQGPVCPDTEFTSWGREVDWGHKSGEAAASPRTVGEVTAAIGTKSPLGAPARPHLPPPSTWLSPPWPRPRKGGCVLRAREVSSLSSGPGARKWSLKAGFKPVGQAPEGSS